MIQVVQPGVLDTIQDMGRYGYQHLGINPGGAMDRIALAVANSLAGNEPGEAAVELHFPASVFRFTQPALIALSGGDFGAVLDNGPLNINRPAFVQAGAILRFTRPVSGARSYLAIHGGLQLQPWLGSCSTNLKAGAGGWQGRRLACNDSIPFQQELPHRQPQQILPWTAATAGFYTSRQPIRVMAGTGWPLLVTEARSVFTTESFMLTAQSDRMGFRLQGPPLQTATHSPMLSAGISRGTIQLLPNGQLIVLMADHQTTGGYARVAHVAGADQPTLSQLSPHNQIHFSLTDHATAAALLYQQETGLHDLQNACKLRLKEWLDSKSL